MSFERASWAYRLLFVAFIVWASAQTIVQAASLAHDAHVASHLVIGLASLEIVCALAFLIPRATVWAAGGLLLVFAIAALHAVVDRAFPAHLVFYAGTVLWLTYLDRHGRGRRVGN